MFLLPLLVLVMAGLVAYTVVHHRAQPGTVTAGGPASVSVHRAPFWPTTMEGRLGVMAFAVSFLPVTLVNVIHVPYLGAVFLLAALALSGVARFARHDQSISVLIAFALCALSVLAGLLFLAGEVFIGHD